MATILAYALITMTRRDSLSDDFPMLYDADRVMYEKTHSDMLTSCGRRDRVRLYRVSASVVLKQTTCDLAVREHEMLLAVQSIDGVMPVLEPRAYLHPSRAWSAFTMPFVVLESVNASCQFLEQALRLFAALRAARIVHRDVSRTNLVMRNGRPFLLDFAWAMRVDEPRPAPRELGSWKPPLARSCDVFSFACDFHDLFDDKPCGGVLADTTHCRVPIEPTAIELLAQTYRREASVARWHLMRPLLLRENASTFAVVEYGSWSGFFSRLVARAHANAIVVSLELERERVAEHRRLCKELGVRNNLVCQASIVGGEEASAQRVLASHHEHQRLEQAPRVNVRAALASLDCAVRYQIVLSTTHWWGLATQQEAVAAHAAVFSASCYTFVEIPGPTDGAVLGGGNAEQQSMLRAWYRAPLTSVRALLQASLPPSARLDLLGRVGDRETWLVTNACSLPHRACTRRQLGATLCHL